MEEICKLFSCEFCKNTYTTRSNLYAHIRRKHPHKIDVFKLKKPVINKCITCGKEYSTKQKLKQHGSKAKHPAIDVNLERVEVKYSCKLCHYSFTRSDLVNHIQSHHNIKIEKEVLKFNTYHEFEMWKYDVEKVTRAFYTKNECTYHCLNSITTIFNCNRSGFYKSVSKGLRQLKAQGSVKIDSFCPASIKLRQKGDECEVEYTKTHFGHENILSHLYVSKPRKEALAAKIAAKIPFDVILGVNRNNVDTTNLNRDDLVTRKDLYNIRHSYNLKSLPTTHNKTTSVQAWVSHSNVDTNNSDQEMELQIDLKCEEIEESTSAINESMVNESCLLQDSYLALKKTVENRIQDIMSCCTTISHFKIFDKALYQVKSELEALNHGLMWNKEINIKKNKTAQTNFVSTIKKEPHIEDHDYIAM